MRLHIYLLHSLHRMAYYFSITIFQNHDKFNDCKSNTAEKCESFNFEETPYIVCCGPLERLQCCHIVWKDLQYDFNNITAAVDVLYKSFFVLQIDFPFASAHIWCFLQKYVYRMEKSRRLIAVRIINELIVELDKQNI